MSSGWRFHNFSSYLSFVSSPCNFLATLFVRRSQDSPSRVYCLLVELKSIFIWEWKWGYNGPYEKVQLMAIGQWWERLMWKSFRWRKKIRMDKFWLINETCSEKKHGMRYHCQTLLNFVTLCASLIVALEIIWMYIPQNIWGKSKWIYVTKFVLNFSILMFQADQRDVMSEPWMTCSYLGPVCGQICQGLVKQTPWKKENNFKSGGKLLRNKRPKL